MKNAVLLICQKSALLIKKRNIKNKAESKKEKGSKRSVMRLMREAEDTLFLCEK